MTKYDKKPTTELTVAGISPDFFSVLVFTKEYFKKAFCEASVIVPYTASWLSLRLDYGVCDFASFAISLKY